MKIALAIVLLLCLPAICRSVDTPTGIEAWSKQVEESEALRRKWGELTGAASGASPSQMIANLEAALKKYDSHPVTPWILISLAELNEADSPTRAEDYYVKAMTFPVASDLWKFAQQRATRQLARFYERQRKFQQSAAILEDWKISEPCGNGQNDSDARRWLKIWELRLHFQPKNAVLADLWRVIAQQKLEFAFAENKGYCAAQVRQIYGADELDRLQADSKAFRATACPGRLTGNFLDEVERQVKVVKLLRKADLSQLIAQARDMEKRTNFPGNLTRIPLDEAWGTSQPLLPELLAAMKKPGAAAIPALIKEHESHYSALVLYSIATTGGQDAVAYLKQKAVKETNIWNLKDYYYCLLVTGDTESKKMIEEMAASATEDNRPEAAKWALSALLPGQKWSGWRPYP